jgi:hypothetical protein
MTCYDYPSRLEELHKLIDTAIRTDYEPEAFKAAMSLICETAGDWGEMTTLEQNIYSQPEPPAPSKRDRRKAQADAIKSNIMDAATHVVTAAVAHEEMYQAALAHVIGDLDDDMVLPD